MKKRNHTADTVLVFIMLFDMAITTAKDNNAMVSLSEFGLVIFWTLVFATNEDWFQSFRNVKRRAEQLIVWLKAKAKRRCLR